MTPTAFGTLMSLEPAFGLLLGLILLGQTDSLIQIGGIAIVVCAGALALAWRARRKRSSTGWEERRHRSLKRRRLQRSTRSSSTSTSLTTIALSRWLSATSSRS